MPLSMTTEGDSVTIVRLTGTDEVRQHLSEIGFVVGDRVTVICNSSGNMILQVKEGRIALDRKMANRIQVGLSAE
ncbi:MAG: ferrous iron transport protein A [Lachnospiraceae bacterium]|nr:ferrous iron transport protein A [Lachnospiraceae bacterium]